MDKREGQSAYDWVAHAAEADGEPPHPPFGHLLPGGEKGTVIARAERARREGRQWRPRPEGRGSG